MEASPALGAEVPGEAIRIRLLEGGKAALPTGAAQIDPASPDARGKLQAGLGSGSAVRLDFGADSYLSEAAPLLALLDDLDVALWLPRPDGRWGHRLVLRDEEAFRDWIDEAKPGKVRVIQRADGFELQSNLGKLPGVDPNGPSVPARGGRDDVATLRRGLQRLKERFPTAGDVCFVPSFGMELRRVAEAMSGAYLPPAPGEPLFEQLCLVYPRPKAPAAAEPGRDAGTR